MSPVAESPSVLPHDPELVPVSTDFFRGSFVHGDGRDHGLRVNYFFRRRDGHLFGEIAFRPTAKGFPGVVHGGAIAAILDDALGGLNGFNGHLAMTANLSIDYHKPLPVAADAALECWIERVEGRKIFNYGELRVGDSVHASGRGVFVKCPEQVFGEYLEPLKRHYRMPVGGTELQPG